MSTKRDLDHDAKALYRTIDIMEKQEKIMSTQLQSFREGLAFVKELAEEIHTECRPHLPDAPDKPKHEENKK